MEVNFCTRQFNFELDSLEVSLQVNILIIIVHINQILLISIIFMRIYIIDITNEIHS